MSLRNCRIKNHMSQRELSDYSQISLRTIQEYEQGRRLLSNAKTEVVYKLSIILGCSIEELLEEDEDVQDYPYTIVSPITSDSIRRMMIYSKKYQAVGRFKFRGDSCYVSMIYKGKPYEVGLSIIFNEQTIPWVEELARMRMETAIEEIEFQSMNTLMTGGSYENWE